MDHKAWAKPKYASCEGCNKSAIACQGSLSCFPAKLPAKAAAGVVHYNGNKNNVFECEETRSVGAKAATYINQVTCLDCLLAIITSRVLEFMEPETEPFCGECANLNYTEAEQDKFFVAQGIKPQHYCNRFHSQIFHAFPFEGNLLRHPSCNICRGFVNREDWVHRL